ncbi:MAG: stress response translation initiation inhibitor YciH [Desulfuromonadaceae bacterium]|nr:stress response translation initiation inhibitor YciH [Desulfuromonadaceae bacterium]MDD2855868.1 stress response translation initiation inhibitor YciH [Desulfuromonadaceae bacterium]
MTNWSDSIPVYSTDSGRIKLPKKAEKPSFQKNDGIVRLRREVKGRGGGTVITISGIPLSAAEIKELAGVLKKKCGCGGTVKDGVIEMQGDHRELLSTELLNRGFKVKLAGG